MPSINISKRHLWILLIVGLLIGLVLILRSCSTSNHIAAHNERYIIGRDSTWYSLTLAGKERNLQAFTDDLFAAIGRETGLRFQFSESSPTLLLSSLDRKEFDAIISPLRPTVVNRESYLFSELFFEIGPVLIVRQNSPINSLKQAQGYTIGISSDSSLIFNAVKETGANVYELSFVSYPNYHRAVEALMNNLIDGVIMGALPAYMLAEGYYAGSIKIVTLPLTDEGIRLIAPKHTSFSQHLISEFNRALNKLKADGTFDALITKWNLIDPEKRFRQPKG